MTRKGEPFKDAQLTRETVAKFAAELLTGKQDYHRECLGIVSPASNGRSRASTESLSAAR
ncbi:MULTISPECIES: hypothetical protein [Bifidobacterium]|uniref:hypothetical protein n=1 Tax=Bifidobacterium TaxID=1678 RepID=UPI000402603C|nr:MULTISPECIES: hypothetical protein [Bifidobacterium]